MYHNKDIDTLELIQRIETTNDLNYEKRIRERDSTNLETRGLRGGQMDVLV